MSVKSLYVPIKTRLFVCADFYFNPIMHISFLVPRLVVTRVVAVVEFMLKIRELKSIKSSTLAKKLRRSEHGSEDATVWHLWMILSLLDNIFATITG